MKRAVATKTCVGIVQLNWVLDSIFEGKRLPICKYIIVDVTHRSPLVVMSAYNSLLGNSIIAPAPGSGLKGDLIKLTTSLRYS